MDYPVTSGTGLDSENRGYLRGIDDLLPDIKYILPRCDTEITMRKTLAEVCQKFCRETEALVCTSEIAVVNGQRRYVIPLSLPADILTVQSVALYLTVNGVEQDFPQVYATERYIIDDPAEEDNVYIEFDGALNLSAGTTGVFKVKAALIPFIDESLGTQAYALPDKFLRRWRSAIVDGAVWRLASMDGRPWTDKSKADECRRRYVALVGEAIGKAQLHNMRKGSASCANPRGWF